MALARTLSGDATVVLVSREHLLPSPAVLQLPTVHPSDTLYIVFTSGSTGTPKGVVTTHQNFASAATPQQQQVLPTRPQSRVFDFVSYSSDVSWSNHLQTLICGGCLSVPSEWERRNDTAAIFNRLRCDYAYFTPSVARSLQPASMPGLNCLAMGGEPTQRSEVARWTQAEPILGIFGPAECAQALSFAVMNSGAPCRNHHVGSPCGANTWLVLPECPDQLAPVGAIGELLIKEPTVSKGYFGSPDKTAAAYIVDPPWLVRGTLDHPGRSGILYKTGDLVRYNTRDGSLDFIGRMDGMVKLRGQRIELVEVEFHVSACLEESRSRHLVDGLVAEIITPQNGVPILAVFLHFQSSSSSGEEAAVAFGELVEELEENLTHRLPHYMIPGAYIPVDEILMTVTNKTDRRVLREMGNGYSLEQLAELQSRGRAARQPSSEMEKRLQGLWASVLGVDAASISADSSFLRIGGESIAAMRLVAYARAQNLSLTVAQISKTPRRGAVRHFQTCAIRDSLQDPPGRLPSWILELPSDVDFARLQSACTALVQRFEILHMVFVEAENRLWQVLLPDLCSSYETYDVDREIQSAIEEICEEDRLRPRHFGQSFVHFMALRHGSILKALFSLTAESPMPTLPPHPSSRQLMVFQHNRKKQSLVHWAARLHAKSLDWGCCAAPPCLNPADRLTITRTFPMQWLVHDDISPATFFHAACAIVVAKQSGQEEVVFGRLVTGRAMLPSVLHNGACPTLTEVPILIHVHPQKDDLVTVAQRLQSLFLDDVAYEAAGMEEIIRHCDPAGWSLGRRDFGWRSAFQQPEPEEGEKQNEDEGEEETGSRRRIGIARRVSVYQAEQPPRSRPEIYATPQRGGSQWELRQGELDSGCGEYSAEGSCWN
ncbi:hypothetical protein BDW74DRAFT_175042 [Aspergillus multicolor]|uniref:uncharacterized protein n=1 Tax=Aspergillus multicolor TaxID=41759 RepID=UPI003CCCE201